MKGFLKKLNAILLSCFLCFNNFFSFIPVRSAISVNAEEPALSTSELGGMLVLWLASMGILTSSQSPNLNNWIWEKFEDFQKNVKKLTDEQMNQMRQKAERQALQRAEDGKKLLKIGSDLYNAYSDFATWLISDKNINNSSTKVTIGNSNIQNYFPVEFGYFDIPSNDVFFCKNFFINNLKFNYIYTNGIYKSDVRLTFGNLYDTGYLVLVSKDSEFSSPCAISTDNWSKSVTLSKDVVNGYNIGSLRYGDMFENCKNFDNGNDFDSFILERSFGSQTESVYPVNVDGTLNLDDRVLTTSKDVTLDLTNVNGMSNVDSNSQLMDLLKQWLLTNSIPRDFPLSDAASSTDVPSVDYPEDIKSGAIEGLGSVFPFCVPYDVKAFFDVLVAEPVAPKWNFKIFNYDFSVNMADFSNICTVFRFGMLGLFISGLILITRHLIGGN